MIRAIVKGHSVTMDPQTFTWSGAPAPLLDELRLATAAAQCARSVPILDGPSLIAEEAVARLDGHLIERETIHLDDLDEIV